MDHHLDIRLRPDPEFSGAHLMSALFAKLHRVLVQLRSQDIAVSFPDVEPARPTLGARMRVHGTAEALQRLMEQSWLTGMHDHVSIGDIGQVPSTAEHRWVRRVQAKSSPERLRRRRIRRHGLSEDQAREQIPDSAARTVTLPYLTVRSSSTGQPFRLFIDHGPPVAPSAGSFNAYGLSTTATVPWF